MNIAMVDLKQQYQRLEADIQERVMHVLSTGAFIGGPAVKQFEDEMSAYMNCSHAIGCANGTDALMIALMAIGVQPGDEVITSPFTFVATAETIALMGAKPIYADIVPGTYNIDPSDIEHRITEKTKAIIPVHIWGQSADMDAIMDIARKHHLKVIEDNAQAVGADYRGKKCGTIGDIGTISYYPAKNLGAYGDAGMILTGNDELAERIRMICNHGSKIRYHHEILGVNSRLDAIQAAILSVKLTVLDGENEARRKWATRYNELLNCDAITIPEYADYGSAIVHQYGILVEDRDGLQEHLKEKGVPTAIHYPIPLHLQPAFKNDFQGEGSLPLAERVASNVLNLPIHPYLTEEQVTYICDTVRTYVGC